MTSQCNCCKNEATITRNLPDGRVIQLCKECESAILQGARMTFTQLEIVRRRRGWTQIKLGRRAGVHSSNISRFEHGLTLQPSNQFKRKIAKALGVPRRALFELDGA